LNTALGYRMNSGGYEPNAVSHASFVSHVIGVICMGPNLAASRFAA
jgi:hypothetical protein